MFFFALLKEKLRNWSKKKTSLSFHELYSIYRLVKNILASAYGFIMNFGKFWKKENDNHADSHKNKIVHCENR